MGNITIQGDLTGDVPGGEVGGASNLTTVGAIPYVSASGTLNQDATALFWDATNDRLGVGTNAPGGIGGLSGSLLDVRGYLVVANNKGITSLDAAGAGVNTLIRQNTSNGTEFYTVVSYDWFINSVNRMRLATTGNFLLGTTTDSNFKLDVAASGSSGTFRVYDQTATTGVTRAVIRAGAGQSTTNLTEWQNAAGTRLSYIYSDGSFFGPGVGVEASGVGRFYTTSTTQRIYNSGVVAWGSGADAYSFTGDTSLSRASAGVLQVGDGGSNANGVVSLTRSQHAGVLVAALPAAAAGNAGSIQYVTDANATTIGSTVAGGGANKVMVWSDGAAWKIFAS